MSDLFRNQALQAVTSRNMGVVIVRTPKKLNLALYLLATICAAAILLFFLASITRKISVEGRVQPSGGVVNLYAQSAGIVRNINAEKVIKKNQTLLVINNEKFADKSSTEEISKSAKEKFNSISKDGELAGELIKEQLKGLDEEIGYQDKNIAQMKILLEKQKERLSISKKIYEKYKNLYEDKFISELGLGAKYQEFIDQESAVLSAENKLIELQGLIRNKKNERDALIINGERLKEEGRRSIESARADIMNGDLQSKQELKSPINADNVNYLVVEGQAVIEGQLLVSLFPQNEKKKEAVIYIPSDGIGFVKTKSKVNIKYDAFPFQKFGSHPAEIKSIGGNAYSAEELNAGLKPGYYYKAIVDIPYGYIVTYGKKTPLPVGTSIKVDISIERRKLFEWIIEPLYTMQESI